MEQKNKSILIVDDDVSILRVFERILQRKGYRVETAETSKAAMEKVKSQPFDLALIDVILPDMNGLDLMPKLEAIQPKMAKIIITGQPSDEWAARARNNGAYAFLTKPVAPKTLIRIIEEKLKKHENT